MAHMHICRLEGNLHLCGLGQLCSKLHRVRVAFPLVISIQRTAKLLCSQCGAQFSSCWGMQTIPPTRVVRTSCVRAAVHADQKVHTPRCRPQNESKSVLGFTPRCISGGAIVDAALAMDAQNAVV